MLFYRDCFTPLITTKFRQAFEPHINRVSTGPRRGALKPSGGLLIAFSGGLGPSVVLDLVHRVYCANVGSDELKGGKEHPRRNRVWERIHVCYVETSDVFPEASQPLCDPFSPFSQTLIRRTTELRRFARLSPATRDASLFQCVYKTRSIGAGGNEFPAGELSVSQKCPLAWVTMVRPIGSLKELSKSLTHSPSDSEPTAALKAHLRALPTPTATLSTLSTLTRLLLLYTAYSIGASHLVLGTSLTSLSITLISSISQGGGFVVPQAIQEEWIPPFVKSTPGATSWNGEVRVIRPLRDVNMKECNAWVWWHQLSVVGKQSVLIAERTIGNLTKGRLMVALVKSRPDDSADFIIGLEKDYPSTVSTIAKTVGKLSPKGESGMRCVLCEL